MVKHKFVTLVAMWVPGSVDNQTDMFDCFLPQVEGVISTGTTYSEAFGYIKEACLIMTERKPLTNETVQQLIKPFIQVIDPIDGVGVCTPMYRPYTVEAYFEDGVVLPEELTKYNALYEIP